MARAQRKPKPSDSKPARTPTSAKKKPRRRWVRRLVTTFIVLIILVCLSPYIVVGIATAGRLQSLDEVEPHDVAVVFGAGLYGDQPSPYLRGRLIVARDLFLAGKVKVILLTGDNLTPYHNEPEVMMNWLIDNGIPADKIVADFAGEDTYSSCVRALKIFGVSKAILVTQTYHLPRAITTCRLVGVDAVGVGDLSVKEENPTSWRRYVLREIPATANMLYEVLTQREPILGPYETGVDEALGR